MIKKLLKSLVMLRGKVNEGISSYSSTTRISF